MKERFLLKELKIHVKLVNLFIHLFAMQSHLPPMSLLILHLKQERIRQHSNNDCRSNHLD